MSSKSYSDSEHRAGKSATCSVEDDSAPAAQTKWNKVKSFVFLRGKDVLAVTLIFAGFLGLIIHGSFVNRPGPIYRLPHYLGLLLSVMIGVSAAQLLYLQRKRYSPKIFNADIFYFGVLTPVSFFLFLGYAIGSRADGALWSLTLLLVNALNFETALRRRRSNRRLGAVVEEESAFRDEEKEAPVERTRAQCIGFWALVSVNTTLKTLMFIFTVLMLGGSWIQGVGYASLKTPGTYVDVTYSLGTQKFHYFCDGPQNGKPTFWLEPGGGHTMADFYGLQMVLVAGQRRVCIYDRPGMGLTDYAFAKQDSSFYAPLIRATGEPGPFIIAAWAGGAPLALDFVSDNPSMVRGLILMDVYGKDYEFRSRQAARNLTDAEIAAYKKEQLSSRVGLFGVIRGIAVQWGLMSFFVGGAKDRATFLPPEKYDEFRFINSYNEKSWTTQFFAMLEEFGELPSPHKTQGFAVSLPATMPVLVMASKPDSAKSCADQNFSPGSIDCTYITREQDFGWAERLTALSLTSNTTLATCSPNCDLGFPVANATWTGQSILAQFGWVV